MTQKTSRQPVRIIDQIYINGQFVKPLGTTTMDLFNPATGAIATKVTLGDERDAQLAIAAAKAAFKTFSKTTIAERAAMLQRLHDVIVSKTAALNKAAVEEYGSPITATNGRTIFTAQNFLESKKELENFEFVKYTAKSKILMEPLGVIAAITPWNADYTHIAEKLSPAIAMGCTMVIKPSELSAVQTQLFIECIHEAGLPAGVVNVVNGTGPIVGNEFTRHPDVAMISFTGSTTIGKLIARDAAATMKRLLLELGGKSPNIILDDADFSKVIPMALRIAFSNSGQACHAGSRLIVPEHRLDEVKELVRTAVKELKVGHLWDQDAFIGPMVSQRQYDIVQRYIQAGIEEGATLVTGGEGHPDGLTSGYYVKPTVFAGVTMDMRIAQEEIFGPVLCILTYKTVEEAVAIANDTIYGLAAYVSSGDINKANAIAEQITSGRVLINKMVHDDPDAPFGGFKQSGIGRCSGVYAMQSYVEPKAILGYNGK